MMMTSTVEKTDVSFLLYTFLMYLYARSGATIVAIFLALGSIFFASTLRAATATPGDPVGIAAETGIPCSNPHRATEDDVAAGYPPDSLVCPSDYQQSDITPESGEAKRYLSSIFRDGGGRCSELTQDVDKIENLNPTFAVCAAKFLQAVRQQDSSIYITSAYRTSNQQGCMCGNGSSGCAAAGRSNHQQGIALDLHARNYAWLQAQIRSFPGLRHLTIANDPYHMEAIKGGPCMTAGYTPPDFTASQFIGGSPTSQFTQSIRDYAYEDTRMCALPDGNFVRCSSIANLGNSPTTGLSSGSAVSPSLPSSGSSVSQTTSSSNEPTTCSPSFFCKGSVRYYKTSTCEEQVNEVCAGGCSSGACIGPSKDDPLTAALSETKSTSTSTSTQTTSAFDLISAIANPDAVGVPADPQAPDVIVGSEEAARLEDTAGNPAALVPLGSIQTITPGAQQTFRSPDLQDTVPFVQNFSNTPSVLESMRQTLLSILTYLRPFGRPHEHIE